MFFPPSIAVEVRKLRRTFALRVYLAAPKEIRLERIWQRELQRFENRVLEGGDLFESQLGFGRLRQGGQKSRCWLPCGTFPARC